MRRKRKKMEEKEGERQEEGKEQRRKEGKPVSHVFGIPGSNLTQQGQGDDSRDKGACLQA